MKRNEETYKMATRSLFLATIKKWNATFEEFVSHDEVTILIDSPRNIFWKATDCGIISRFVYTGWKPCLYAECIDVMNEGQQELSDGEIDYRYENEE